MIKYVIIRFWFKTLWGILVLASLSVGLFFSVRQAKAFQVATATLPGVYATVVYTEPINVRSGPNTVHYPIVGHLVPGDVVPALGVTPGREWVQIAYPDAADGTGTGWVYAIYVTISGGELRVVEAPSTPTPPITATLDATLEAEFNFQPTPSRMPTFTPPPPLTVPQFTEVTIARPSGVAPGIFVIVLVFIGIIGLVASIMLGK